MLFRGSTQSVGSQVFRFFFSTKPQLPAVHLLSSHLRAWSFEFVNRCPSICILPHIPHSLFIGNSRPDPNRISFMATRTRSGSILLMALQMLIYTVMVCYHSILVHHPNAPIICTCKACAHSADFHAPSSSLIYHLNCPSIYHITCSPSAPRESRHPLLSLNWILRIHRTRSILRDNL